MIEIQNPKLFFVNIHSTFDIHYLIFAFKDFPI
jgi:hypothetical protein